MVSHLISYLISLYQSILSYQTALSHSKALNNSSISPQDQRKMLARPMTNRHQTPSSLSLKEHNPPRCSQGMSQTPWVGCMRGIDQREGEPAQYHNGGEVAHQQGKANLSMWLLIAPRSYPQAPRSSQSLKSNSSGTLMIGFVHDTKLLVEG